MAAWQGKAATSNINIPSEHWFKSQLLYFKSSSLLSAWEISGRWPQCCTCVPTWRPRRGSWLRLTQPQWLWPFRDSTSEWKFVSMSPSLTSAFKEKCKPFFFFKWQDSLVTDFTFSSGLAAIWHHFHLIVYFPLLRFKFQRVMISLFYSLVNFQCFSVYQVNWTSTLKDRR